MGHHCCSKQKVKRGLWSPEEDEKLMKYITAHGHGCWSSVPKLAGLQRCGKSCRLRWINYLRPDLKRGTFSAHEERIIIDVHRILGNRWAQIAKHLPGRTDNEVKNFWNSCIKKKLIAQGLDPKTHNLMPSAPSRASNNSNNNVTNFSQFHQSKSSTTIPFTISTTSNIKNFEKTNSMDQIINSPTVVTLPQSTSICLNDTIPSSSFQYQDPNVLMSFKDQDLCNLMDYTNCSSSSLGHANISPNFNHSEFMDEACMWAGNAVGTVEGPKGNGLEEELKRQEQVQEQAHDINEEMSYSSSAFDLELMDSALMPCGMFSNGSSMEQLQWDC